MCELKPPRTSHGRRALCAAACLLLCALAATPGAAQQQRTCNSAKQCLSLGLLYYNNDDISGQAAVQFRKVLTTYKKSAVEAEKAQFYLASYYQRKYYITRERTLERDGDALSEAVKEYQRYTTNYINQKSKQCAGTCEFLADAFFNLALVFMEQGSKGSAANELHKMKDFAPLDPSVYVYQVVWSPRYEDVVDGHLPASDLAQYTRLLSLSSLNADAIMLSLKTWCQQHKNNRA